MFTQLNVYIAFKIEKDEAFFDMRF